MLLLDTSFLIELESEVSARVLGAAKCFLAAKPLESVAVSIISLGEFAEGFEDKNDVEAFLSRFRIVSLSRSIAYKAAAMQASLSQRLGENDAWIAATALTYDADLIGREKAFGRVPRLRYKTF
ncbi:MAG: type II toxin-antitoxin system VapC family toxin [Opitutaceae bacterium]|jgi:predicted nucleic acid-binding protein|nr:type II toxin-antitoxin system VapC family toxin [Opitutaceae bacterium]